MDGSCCGRRAYPTVAGSLSWCWSVDKRSAPAPAACLAARRIILWAIVVSSGWLVITAAARCRRWYDEHQPPCYSADTAIMIAARLEDAISACRCALSSIVGTGPLFVLRVTARYTLLLSRSWCYFNAVRALISIKMLLSLCCSPNRPYCVYCSSVRPSPTRS